MKRIAIEENLSDIRSALQEKGYDLVTLKNQEDANDCECCIISGQDRNVMGIMNTETKGSVIDAHGRTADEVCQEVESRFS
ncbi:YkuS family protein [Halobacillus rhizosphaerae]|uniref:YkuS family protein n=1 Tax=Halobacillus rhizosphaerae TaxID=3064889 RepID=UPI00398BA239